MNTQFKTLIVVEVLVMNQDQALVPAYSLRPCSPALVQVHGAMNAFPIKSTITSCEIHSARPLCCSDAFQVSKIIGSASQGSSSFDPVLNLNLAVTGPIDDSIGCTLNHCYIPRRSEYSTIPLNTVEIVLVLHNEPPSNVCIYLSRVWLDLGCLSR